MQLTLKALRAQKNWSQKQAAEAVGINPATWYNYEHAKSYPNALTIRKIEKVFGVQYDDIIFLPNDMMKS